MGGAAAPVADDKQRRLLDADFLDPISISRIFPPSKKGIQDTPADQIGKPMQKTRADTQAVALEQSQ